METWYQGGETRCFVESCLSPYHISTQPKTVEVEPPSLTFTREGYLATVTRAMVSTNCAGGCGRIVKVPLYRFHENGEYLCRECRKIEVKCSKCGSVFRMTPRLAEASGNVCSECGGSGEGKRGRITTFSRRASNRLAREVARVKLSTRLNFVTLTFSDQFPFQWEPVEWKRHLKRFEARFRRAFPAGSYVWKLEIVERKSGEHAGELFPHFHLLVTGIPRHQLAKWVATTWYEVAGYGDPDHLQVHSHPKVVQIVRSQRQVRQYAAKKSSSYISAEVSKRVQSLNNGESVGRYWGIIAREIFDQLKSALHTLAGDAFTEKHAIILLRYFRRIAHLRSRSYYKLNCFILGKWITKNIARVLEPVVQDRYRSTGRKYDEPFYQWAYDNGKWEPALES